MQSVMQADEEELKSSRSKGVNSRWTGQHIPLHSMFSPWACLRAPWTVVPVLEGWKLCRAVTCKMNDKHWAGSSGSSISGYVASDSWWMSSSYKSKWYRKKSWGRIIYKIVLGNRTKGCVKLSISKQMYQGSVSYLASLFSHHEVND